LDKLYSYGIDVNPSNGRFDFEVRCEVEQGNKGPGTNTISMKVNVDRTYDDGNLKGSLIGVIVGVVLAVILLIVAIALLVFAKASNRWCFAEDDYKNPNDARAHPNSRSGGGGMRRPANQGQY